MKKVLLLFLWLSVGCTPAAPLATPRTVTVYSTSAAEPWLVSLYDCAGASTVLIRVADPASAEIILRIGELEFLDAPAYQIGTEEILIVTHRQSPVQNLTLEEARLLFAGQGDPSVEVWVFAAGEDVQEVLDRIVMEGQRVSASARLAVSLGQMSDTLVREVNTVGVLPRHWKKGEVREVLTVATIPVLAITSAEPTGGIRELIACLQK